MQLREIHIDGFGIFCEKHVTGLSSGLNLLYGPNEFGKSTLLAFLRRILFGFRVSSSANPYPAVSGGAYGGRIICQLANGKVVTISRKQGRSGGPVEIVTDSGGEHSGQEELNRMIGGISEKFYENVYAIGLDELQALRTLEEEEVKNHIYGAGLELGSTSLTEIQNTFLKQAEGVFKPGGSAQRIPALYKEIRDREKAIAEGRRLLSKYDELVSERDRLQDRIDSLDDEIGKLDQERRRVQAQQTLFPTYVKLKDAEANLARLAETPLFSEDSLAKLDKLETAVSSLDKQTKSEANELRELERTRDSQLFDDKIIDLEPSIISLQKQSERFKSASQDIGEVRLQMATLSNSIRTRIEKLGSGWTEENVRNFKLSHLQEDESHTTKERIEEAKRKIDNVKSKLEAHLDSKAAEESRGVGIAPFLRNSGYVSVAVGAAGFVLGFVLSQPALSVFSGCLLAVGLILSLSGRKPNLPEVPTPLEKKYEGDLSLARSEYERVHDEWRGQLRSMGFDENLSPDGALEVVRTIREIQTDQDSLAGLATRDKAMKEAIDTVNNLLSQTVASLGKTKISDDVVATIEILAEQLNRAKVIKNKKESSKEEINRKQQKIRNIQEAWEQAKQELKEYLTSFDATDESDFRLKHQVFRERQDLNKTIENCRTTIQSVVGMGEHYDEFLASLSAAEPAVISAELDAQERRLEELKVKRDESKERIGELRVRIDDLSATDLVEDQTELEVKKQQLRDCSADWVRSQIALYALEKAISKYEDTRQPEVIKAAASVFDNITNHTYPTIIKPTGSNELVIQDRSAKRKTIKEMSRGTREQLYFAMRLGLIQVYETDSEPMPVMMDDILVNFDDDRGPAAIAGLVGFSKDRQVIILTCHKNTLDIYKSLGAREVALR